VPDNAPELRLVREWLDNWSGIGLIIAGMTHQGWDVQLTDYAARDWRANFFPVGIAHSVVGGPAWEPTPWRAVQRAAWSEQDGVRYSALVGSSRTGRRSLLAHPLRPSESRGRLAVKAQRPLVLLIEDSDDTRDMFAAVLHLEGFTVEEARDGREGIEKAAESLPDIIITDLRMPVMDGCEMIQRLRADQRTRRIPIIACSSEERLGTGSTPANAFGPKPCPLDLLLLEVRGVLRRAAA
jgi:CheY-like chemotaxis protein